MSSPLKHRQKSSQPKNIVLTPHIAIVPPPQHAKSGGHGRPKMAAAIHLITVIESQINEHVTFLLKVL